MTVPMFREEVNHAYDACYEAIDQSMHCIDGQSQPGLVSRWMPWDKKELFGMFLDILESNNELEVFKLWCEDITADLSVRQILDENEVKTYLQGKFFEDTDLVKYIEGWMIRNRAA